MGDVLTSYVELNIATREAQEIPIGAEKIVHIDHYDAAYFLGENRRSIESAHYDIFLIDRRNIFEFLQACIVQQDPEIPTLLKQRRTKAEKELKDAEEKKIELEEEHKEHLSIVLRAAQILNSKF